MGRRLRHWPLWRQLLLGILALLTVIAVIIGTVSVLSLQRFMTDKLDAQLIAAAERSRIKISTPQLPGYPGIIGEMPKPEVFLAIPGQSTGTVAALVIGKQVVVAAVLDELGNAQSLGTGLKSRLLALDAGAGPVTVNLGPELGEYRVVAATAGELGAVLLVGLPLDGVLQTSRQLAAVVIAVTLAALLLAAWLGMLVVRGALRPLRRVAETATQVSELALHQGQVDLSARVAEADPDTEVGQLGAAFNRMLDHVAGAFAFRQTSEDELRRFVADASHELRTPLASIRGYAELTRRGGYELHPDAAHALSRVEAEAIRMGTLVEELLLLARLDAETVLERSEVELAPLLADALSDARAAGPGHHWSLEAPDEPVIASVDAARLHQIVGNLLANARTHTPEGTAVLLSLQLEADAVLIGVADDGPGIPPEMLPTVFHRFARGDSSRSRIAGSTGLGLAIVQALVHAHGGDIAVESVPGSTRFIVRLPR